MQKARCHPEGLQPLVSTRFQVLFHSAVCGSFHLSFTVLVRYRSLKCIQPYRMVPVASHKASPTSRYSGYYYNVTKLVYRAFTLYCAYFHLLPLSIYIDVVVLQPQLCRNKTGLGYSPFARHYLGNHFCFLFLQVLRCFSSLSQRLKRLLIFNQKGFPIRRSADYFVFANTRSLSQLITSFIAIESQGIHHVPLVTFIFKLISMNLFSSNMSKNFFRINSVMYRSMELHHNVAPLN